SGFSKRPNSSQLPGRAVPFAWPSRHTSGFCRGPNSMRIHVTFIDRIGITQEVLALLVARHLNLEAVEMVPPNVYIDAPAIDADVLDELRQALRSVDGVQDIQVVGMLPGQQRRLQLDALLHAMPDPLMAVDGEGKILMANPALISLVGRDPEG